MTTSAIDLLPCEGCRPSSANSICDLLLLVNEDELGGWGERARSGIDVCGSRLVSTTVCTFVRDMVVRMKACRGSGQMQFTTYIHSRAPVLIPVWFVAQNCLSDCGVGGVGGRRNDRDADLSKMEPIADRGNVGNSLF